MTSGVSFYQRWIRHEAGSVVGAFVIAGYARCVQTKLFKYVVTCRYCQATKVMPLGDVVRGKSCGCKTKSLNSKAHVKHGMARDGERSAAYVSWRSMVDRCTRPKNNRWQYYGGRGIKVCERWLHSSKNFLADMGERPDGTTLDRIDVNGNYEPGNCRWATPKQQTSNRRPAKTAVAHVS